MKWARSSLENMQLTGNENRPLSERVRPVVLDDIVGQDQALGLGTPLGRLLRSGHVPNMVIWGPPGTGKTSFALLVASLSGAEFISANAVDTGAKILKELGEGGKERLSFYQKKTILFIDEIHRLNKAQQDVLLSYMERGEIILIGATTENPSYELNRALLSRLRLVLFQRLNEVDLRKLTQRCLAKLDLKIENFLSPDSIKFLVNQSDGDGRRLINVIESLYSLFLVDRFQFPYQKAQMIELCQNSLVNYDKNSEFHYDLISAFIKSIRGSDPDAAIYYLVRMLKGGEDPLFIARRLIILASEDIGNADPRGLTLAVSAFDAVERIGLPEGEIPLAQVTTYLASTHKSNRAYMALKKAKEVVAQRLSLPVPVHLRSGRTELCKEIDYGRDYQYPHDYERGFVNQTYLPEEIKEEKFYSPSNHGYEKNISEYLNWLRKK